MPLFSKSSLVFLESLSFTKTLYAFDFDGTLAKIVNLPSDARMSRTTEHLLQELSSLVPVAIVSGRSLEDLKSRMGFQPALLIGNHGLEMAGENGRTLRESKVICQDWLKYLDGANFGAGVEIEDKVYSLAIHYRRSRSKKESKKQIQEVVSGLEPKPRVLLGKSVINLLPPGAPHKGAAILDLIHRLKMKHIFYVGDDDTDEDVFALDYDLGQLMSVRVGQKKSSQAKYFIKRQSEINLLIQTIIRFHHSDQEKNHA